MAFRRMVLTGLLLGVLGLLLGACTSDTVTTSSESASVPTTAASNTTLATEDSTTTSAATPDGDETDDEAILAVAATAPVASFDPVNNPTVGDLPVWALSYETLLVQQADGTLAPALASDWEVSDDGLTITFSLRNDVVFHNGETFEADDVVFSYERAKASGVPYTEARVGIIETVTAIDERTVEVVLSEPNSGFLQNLANPYPASVAILNREAAESVDPATAMVGTGPFRMVSYSPGTELVFEAFQEYWDGAPSVDGLVVRFMPEESAQIAALRVGEIDLMFPSEESALVLQEDTAVELQEATSANVLSLHMNTTDEPLSDVNVRRAMALAIDPQAVVAGAQLGLGEISGIVSPIYDWAVQRGEHEYYPTAPDTTRARDLLEEAGYTDGFDLELLSFAGLTTRERMMELVAEQLQEIGIRAVVTPVDVPTGVDRLLSANYQIIDNEVAYQSNPFEYLRIRRERTGPVPPEIDVLEQQIVSASPDELPELLRQLQEAQMELVYPSISIMTRKSWVAFDPSRIANVERGFAGDWRFLADVQLSN